MIDRLPRVPQPPRADDYLALLDRALLDRHLSVSEQEALLQVAQTMGLSLAAVMELHRTYLMALASAAWQDTVITDDERKDLVTVADQLGLARLEVDVALAEAKIRHEPKPRLGTFRLTHGDLVVFTGQMKLPRDDWEKRALDAGLRVQTSGLNRRARLLVAADPDSQSGKANTARRYGVPIVGEDTFAKLLGEMEG